MCRVRQAYSRRRTVKTLTARCVGASTLDAPYMGGNVVFQLTSSPVVAVASATKNQGRSSFLEIDAAAFRDNFDRRPFVIGHHLVEHPLFNLARLVELSRKLPAEHVEYNAGNLPLSQDPTTTARNGLSIEETIRRIEECRSWLVLKYVENDPEYAALLKQCLEDVAVHSERLHPGMCKAQAFIFITSPNSVTPYHMDPEHNFLLQIRGRKIAHMFDPRDRSILSEEELEGFYRGRHRNLVFREEHDAKAWKFDLSSGQGLHFPVTAPHYVKNGPEVSLSFSITFRTPDLDRRVLVHNFNASLRRRGWNPRPLGASLWRDSLKCFTSRVGRRLRRLFGKGSP